MKKLLCILVIALSTSMAYGEAQDSFCARINGLYFKAFNGRIHAYGYLDQVTSFTEKKEMEIKKIVISDPQVVFKLAKVVSQLSIQNSPKLQEDLKTSQFEWDYLVGHELSPHPYEENFETCLKADLSKASEDGSLSQITEILDVLEDGYSVKDLLY